MTYRPLRARTGGYVPERVAAGVPLQNRVTPYGAIEALPGRGLLTGNRGVLVDDDRRIVRKWQVMRWLLCRLHIPGRRRQLMQPHRWTELFFLDEAAAFAAGHRPCAACLYEDYKRFKGVWTATHGAVVTVDDIDRKLHAERLAKGGTKRTYRAALASLPDGTYVALDGTPHAIAGDRLYAWSAGEYMASRPRPVNAEVEVLTPPSLVAVIANGYAPMLHPTLAER